MHFRPVVLFLQPAKGCFFRVSQGIEILHVDPHIRVQIIPVLSDIIYSDEYGLIITFQV